MLYWTPIFFVVAMLAALLGWSGVAASAAGIAKLLFVVFLLAFTAGGLLSLPKQDR